MSNSPMPVKDCDEVQIVTSTSTFKEPKAVPFYICFHCSKTFPSVRKMNDHAVKCPEKGDKTENYICSYCDDFSCETFSQMKKHRAEFHRAERKSHRKWRKASRAKPKPPSVMTEVCDSDEVHSSGITENSSRSDSVLTESYDNDGISSSATEEIYDDNNNHATQSS